MNDDDIKRIAQQFGFKCDDAHGKTSHLDAFIRNSPTRESSTDPA
jgi:hypothetical protein